MSIDTSKALHEERSDPYRHAAAVTPHDTNDLAYVTRALWVSGGSGSIKVDMAGTGTAVTLTGVAAGTLLPIAVTRVYSTDTDATGVVALW